jgi:hypothetical protein
MPFGRPIIDDLGQLHLTTTRFRLRTITIGSRRRIYSKRKDDLASQAIHKIGAKCPIFLQSRFRARVKAGVLGLRPYQQAYTNWNRALDAAYDTQ